MHQQILLFVIVTLSCLYFCEAQTDQKQCAKNNEYCLTHRDCCSGSCLSFSYKCVPVPASASEGFISVPVKPVPIDTANRFGADDGGASLTQKTCALNGEYCLTHMECCSGNCLTFSYKCVPLSPSDSAMTGPLNSTPQISMVNFTNRIGDETSSILTTTHTSVQKCVLKLVNIV